MPESITKTLCSVNYDNNVTTTREVVQLNELILAMCLEII
jgi:hypothetical protein